MLKKIGTILAAFGGFVLRSALVVSQHPEVVTAVAGAVGHPEIASVVNTANAAIPGIVATVDAVKAAKGSK